MKKLTLHVEDLAVVSFAITESPRERGTVAGHQYSNTSCHQDICMCQSNEGVNTCAVTCVDNTCYASCYNTCWATCYNSCDTACPTDPPTNGADIC
jgi:hypothetical protein